jgi:hypothetical protein
MMRRNFLRDLLRSILRKLLLRRMLRSLQERVAVKGVVTVSVYDKNGRLIHQETGENLIVDQGKQYLLANILNETTRYNGAYLAISSSSVAPTASETAVPNLISAKTATKSKQISTTPFYAEWAVNWDTTEANGTTIASVAICETSTGGGEWARYVLVTAITKTSDIAVQVQYRLQL